MPRGYPKAGKRRVRPAEERFWSFVDKSAGPDACWPWTGALGGRNNDGPVFAMAHGHQVSARRACWLFVHGVTLTKAHIVTPECGTASCMNPTHLALRPWVDVEARFWSMVKKSDDPNGCWTWTGALYRRNYGAFRYGRKVVAAHRYSYELANGPIEGHDPASKETCKVVMHRCDNPICVRPDHLELGTYKSNQHDMIAKGRAAWQRDPVAYGEAIRTKARLRRKAELLNTGQAPEEKAK